MMGKGQNAEGQTHIIIDPTSRRPGQRPDGEFSADSEVFPPPGELCICKTRKTVTGSVVVYARAYIVIERNSD
ncbi:hypothetical protein TKK_0019159 [Trichogramma kaykai]